jgi:two-component system sensor histidine kinase TctE
MAESVTAQRASHRARGPRTLRRQLLVWLAAPLVALWSISGVVDYDIAKRFVNLAYDRALLEAALDIGRNVKQIDNQIYVDLPEVALQMLETRESGRLHFLVTGPGGEYISGSHELPSPPDDSTDRVRYYDDAFSGSDIRLVALRHPVNPGSGQGAVLIRVGERLTERAESARQLLFRIMVPQALLIFVAVFLVWYAVGRGLTPLASLQRELAARSHRDLSPLPEQQVPEEVRPLIRAMNELLGRLSEALESRQRFVADAAHQLRTPVAGIKTQTELALRQARTENVQATLKQLHTATEQASRLVNQLLSLARAEPGAGRVQHSEPLDLVALARDTATEWVPQALARNIDLGFDSPLPDARIAGDRFMLREMLNNLLDNAVRYTQPGGQVTVRVTLEPPGVVLSVEDNGPGIPETERTRVFERFYRVLGTGAEGCGLGLAIVREIALSHGGDASLARGARDTGTQVRVVFPLAA